MLEIQIQVSGEEHVETLTTKAWLADTLWELAEEKKGLEMMQEVLIALEKVLGKNHPQTEIARKNVSTYRKANGNEKE